MKTKKDIIKNLKKQKIENPEENYKPSWEIMKYLEDPNFLEIINSEFDKKIVGESEARKTIFMVANMRNVQNLNKSTDNLMINNKSGVGKDHASNGVFEIIPDEEKEELIRTTPKVLSYTRNMKINPLATWKKTALRLEDASNEVLNDDAFKVISSADPNKINKAKIVNKAKILEIDIDGKPSIILTIAEVNPREEILRRYPICSLDEGIDQTKAILKRQAEFAKLGKSIDYNPFIIEALRYLKRIKVKIPFAEKLVKIFCPENVIVRTHFPRFLDYIKSSCALHQYQREKDSDNYYLATRQDYDIARMMLSKTTSNILMIPLDKLKNNILCIFENYNLQKKSVDDLEDLEEIKRLNITPEWLRKQLDWLSSKTFLIKDKEKRFDEAGKIIPKPIFIYSYNKMQKLEIPTWEALESSSIASDCSITSISSNTSISGVSEVIEVKEVKNQIQQNNDFSENYQIKPNDFFKNES